MIESLSSGKSAYFSNGEEIKLFTQLFNRYLGRYVQIHKMYISCEGYQILIRIRSAAVLRRLYTLRMRSKKRVNRKEFMEEPWRIVSEQIRIFHSVYVKEVNKMRGRKGVLVQSRFGRYYFERKEEFKEYEARMEKRREEIRGQARGEYGVSRQVRAGVKWGIYRCKEWVERYMDKSFHNDVVSKLIKNTKNLQNQKNTS